MVNDPCKTLRDEYYKAKEEEDKLAAKANSYRRLPAPELPRDRDIVPKKVSEEDLNAISDYIKSRKKTTEILENLLKCNRGLI